MSAAPQGEDRIRLHDSWKSRLADAFAAPKMQALRQFLIEEKRRDKAIYPPGRQIFAAFDATPFEQVRVVILGQDPYHGPGQAHGLCFSVLPSVPVPPSLENIFKEIERDLGLARPGHGCLLPWARRGVLLLNAVLTVERGNAGSHANRGWEEFTDAAIRRLAEEREHLVLLLWGSYAQKKGQFIDARRHRVLKAPHPSPLSAHRGFLGCGHFSAANQYLAQQGQGTVDFSLPPRAEVEEMLSEP